MACECEWECCPGYRPPDEGPDSALGSGEALTLAIEANETRNRATAGARMTVAVSNAQMETKGKARRGLYS